MSEQHTPAVWEDVATEVTEAVAAVIEPQVRKAADDLYIRMMETVQDYLADNLRFNLSSRLESSEREAVRLRRDCYDLGLQRAEMLRVLQKADRLALVIDSAVRHSEGAEHSNTAAVKSLLTSVRTALSKALGQDGESGT